MTLALLIGAICTALVIWLVLTAPYGWQDEHGFHFGIEPGAVDPWIAGLDERLAARRVLRAQSSAAAKRGHQTRRENRT